VAQGVGPEFKLQYRKKNPKQNKQQKQKKTKNTGEKSFIRPNVVTPGHSRVSPS
jgi:hypothetical protein